MSVQHLVFAIFVVASFAPIASAQPSPRAVSADARRRATEAFERGRRAYSFGNYDVAIAEYHLAFELTGAPEFLFDIAQTHRTKGDKRRALELYNKYLELDPTGAGAASARAHIVEIENELRAEDAAAELRRKAEEDERRKRAAEADAAKRLAAETARLEARTAARRRVADAEAARRKTTARYLRTAGIASTGAGFATLGASALFGLRARSLSHEASATTGMWTEEARRKVDDASSAQRTMYLLLGAGGAIAVAGGVLYYMGVRKVGATADARSLAVVPAPLPGGGAVTLGGTF